MTTASVSILWAAALIWAGGAVMARLSARRYWLVAELAAGAGVLVALTGGYRTLLELVNGGGRPDLLSLVMVALIAFIGLIVVRFSRDYLNGESGQQRYAVALLFTVAAVLALVLTRNLGVVILAWAASSVGLYYLLTFYQQRWIAQIVAHKKFLASRLAEVFMLIALPFIYTETGTLNIDGIAGYVAAQPELSVGLRFAAFMLALGVVFKTAQLPVHGWLIQVMEAPTPVSALLHAGIVNIGGYVVIRMATLFSAAPDAQALLVVVGTITAVLAALVMLTRISIKVRLAWSTCAQMGFMLIECGLGLYELALLHLVAHSLYKAHAFLTAGETVMEVRKRDLAAEVADKINQTRVTRRMLAVPIAIVLVWASVYVWQMVLPEFQVAGIALFIVAIGLAPLLWGSTDAGGLPFVRGLLRVVALVQLYLFWHLGFAAIAPQVAEPSLALTAFVLVSFTALYVLQVWLLAYPNGEVSQKLYPWAYGGFYLDENFTRLTFRIWPARIGAEHSAGIFTGPHTLSGDKA